MVPQSVISICLRKSNMKWITLHLLALCFPTTTADCNSQAIDECIKLGSVAWTRCYEDKIVMCTQRHRMLAGFAHTKVNPAKQAELGPTYHHEVRIPSSALQRIRRARSEESVQVVASVINNTLFQQATLPSRGRRIIPVFGELVLFVKAGNQSVSNLTEPVQLIFKHNNKMENSETCVFWKEDEAEWSTEGCSTTKTEDKIICSCDRLGFFAVLVDVIKSGLTVEGHQGEQQGAQNRTLEGASKSFKNEALSVSDHHAVNLSRITYSGSALSAFCAFISLFIFLDLY